MTLYKVSYTDLRTDDSAYAALAGGLQFNHVAGLQRGLIVLQKPSVEDIERAYSAIAYFHQNETRPSQIQFLRENKEWDLDEVRKRLRRNKSKIVTLADVDLETLSVICNDATNLRDLRSWACKNGDYSKTKVIEFENAEELRKLGYEIPDKVAVLKPEIQARQTEQYQLERFLTKFGAFSRSKNKRTRILEKNEPTS